MPKCRNAYNTVNRRRLPQPLFSNCCGAIVAITVTHFNNFFRVHTRPRDIFSYKIYSVDEISTLNTILSTTHQR